MNKKGVTMTFPVIISAIIALTILVVLLFIYTGFIGRSTEGIDKPATEAQIKAMDAAWCMSELLAGGGCVDFDSASGCINAKGKGEDNKCQFVCTNTNKQRHTIKESEKDISCNNNVDSVRYFCCE